MKQLTLALAALALAACTPPSTPTEPGAEPQQAETAAPPNADPDAPDPLANSDVRGATWADAANSEMLAGAWHYSIQHDGTNSKAVYVAGDDYAVFTFVCAVGEKISLVSDIQLAPDQPTGFGILTPDTRYIFAAQSEGSDTDMPIIAADVPMADPRLDAIAAADSFAFQVAGYSTRIPGDPMLARVLQDCRT